MPLAPLAANNTARYFLKYISNGRQHVTQFRYDDGGSPTPPGAPLIAALVVFWNAVRAFFATDFVIIEGWYIPSGSIVSIPTGIPPLVLAGTQVINTAEAPGYLTFVGRSIDGRKTRVHLLGVGVTPASEGSFVSDYRIYAAEDGQIAAAINALDVMPVVAIGGLEPAWKGYANAGYNAYWQKEMRG